LLKLGSVLCRVVCDMDTCFLRDELERFCASELSDERISEITEHLELCTDCLAMLDEISRERLRELPLEGVPDPTEVVPPTAPGYDILEPLGQGGMGSVWKARQISLGRLVAIKFIGLQVAAGAELHDRFKAEAEAVARLEHPNIVRVYEFDHCVSWPFLAMELVEGGTLAGEIARGRMSPGRAAELVECLARAVHYAHSRGILHRDLKPGNILIAADGTPKIADFGLAKRLDGEVDRTRTGERMGTPAYMSPEQVDGRTAGVATDVYALGVILYQSLTGRLPFLGKTAAELWDQIRTTEPVPLRRRQPTVPRDLDTICLRCLEKNPGLRFPSCEELADELHRFLAGEPVLSRPVGSVERLARWVRRKPVLAGLYAAIATVALLLAFGATIAWLWHKAADARDIASLALDVAEEARKDADRERLKAVAATAAAEEAAKSERIAKESEKKAKEREFTMREELSREDYGRRIVLADYIRRAVMYDIAGKLLDTCRDDLRGWEWYYVHRLCHPEIMTLQSASITAPAISPDGKLIAAGCEDDRIRVRVWDVSTGKVTAAFASPRSPQRPGGIPALMAARELTEGINWIAFTNDGRRLIIQRSEVIQLMDRSTGKASIEFAANGSVLAGSAAGQQGARVVVKDVSGKVSVWDVETGKAVATLDGFDANSSRTVLCRDGTRVVSEGHGPGDAGTQVRIWDLSKGGPAISLGEQVVGSMERVWAVSPDGTRIAIRHQTQTPNGGGRPIILWNVGSGKQIAELPWISGPIAALTLSLGGEEIAIAWEANSRGRQAEIWAVSEKRKRTSIPTDVGEIAFSPDRRWTAIRGGPVRVFPLSTPVPVRLFSTTVDPETLRLKSGGMGAAAFVMGGSQLVIGPGTNLGDSSHELRVVDAGTGIGIPGPTLITNEKNFGGFGVAAMAVSRDGRWIAAGETDSPIRVWDTKTRASVLTIKGPVGLERLAFDPIGSRLAITHNTKVAVHDLATGTEIFAVKSSYYKFTAAAFTPDGTQLVVAALGWVEVWDANTGRQLRRFKVHGDVTYNAVVSPDGVTVVTVGDETVARVWDLKTGKETMVLRGHGEGVKDVAISPDGKRIATLGMDSTLRLWDSKNGLELFNLSLPQTYASVYFSPDGRRIATAGQGGVQLWDSTPVNQLMGAQLAKKSEE
jgi:WD40 repeat protein